MRVTLLVVGRARGTMADPIGEYEKRVRHYFSFQVVEVKEEAAGRGRSPQEVMAAEGERLLARIPDGTEVVALDPAGTPWTSEQLARHLEALAVRSHPGITLVVGGAFGLSDPVLRRADRKLSLSAMTLPHELARLVITEQLYRAGTIQRGEPYHK